MGLSYYILNPFFLIYSLHKIDPLKSILKAAGFLFFTLIIVIFIIYFDDDLEKSEKCNTGIAEHIPDLIT